MRPRLTLALPLACAFLVSVAATRATADDACAGYKWDVSKERALFGGEAQSRSAGNDSKGAPVVEPDRLYVLRLAAQDQVAFSAPPGKKTLTDGSYAGLAALKIPAAGTYRISIDMPVWIDVATNGKLVPAKDYQAQHACDAPRKIVEFDLDHEQQLLLQVSGAAKEIVRLTITRVQGG
jgi:hypothetical protein